MTSHEIIQQCANSLTVLGKTISPQTYYLPSPSFHTELDTLLTDRSIIQLLIEAPRGTAKSSKAISAVFDHIIFDVGEKLVIIQSKTRPEAINRLTKIKNVLNYSQTFRELFGYSGEEVAEIWREDKIRTRIGKWWVTIKAIGTGSPVRGALEDDTRITLYLLDDPDDELNTITKEQMEKNFDYFLGGLAGLDRRGGRVIVIGTPIREGCIVERLRGATNWTTRRYQSYNEETKECLWAEMYPYEWLMNKKKELEELGKLSKFYSEYQCHRADTKIKLANGEIKKIQDVQIGDIVRTDNGTALVKASSKTGYKKIVEVLLENGDIFTASIGHNIKTSEGKTKLENAKNLQIIYNFTYNQEKEAIKARLVGFCLGDGHSTIIHKQGKTKLMEIPLVQFYSKYSQDIEKIILDVELLYGIKYKLQYNKNSTAYYITVSGDSARDLIKSGCVTGNKVSQNFGVPEWIKNNSEVIKKEFIAGLFGAEATKPIEKKKGNGCNGIIVNMSKLSGNESGLLQDVKDILESLGYVCMYSSSLRGDRQSCVLMIGNSADNTAKFLKEIGYRYSEYKEKLAVDWYYYLSKMEYGKRDLIESINDLHDNIKLSFNEISKILNRDAEVLRRIYNRQSCTLPNNYIKFDEWIIDKRIKIGIEIPIINKFYLDEEEVYNIEVDSYDHSYLIEDNINNYNCEIVGDEDRLMKKEYLRWYDGHLRMIDGFPFMVITHEGETEWEIEELIEPKIIPVNTFLGIDPASSTKQTADFSVTLPISYTGKDIYLLDYYRRRVAPTTHAEQIIQSIRTHKPTRVHVETVGYQEMLRDYLRKRLKEESLYVMGMETKITPRTEKSVRLERLHPYLYNRIVWIKKSHTEFVDEMMMYPRGKHDDLLDGLDLATRRLISPSHTLGAKETVAIKNHFQRKDLSLDYEDKKKETNNQNWMLN